MKGKSKYMVVQITDATEGAETNGWDWVRGHA